MESDDHRSDLDRVLERVYVRGRQIRFRRKTARIASSVTAIVLIGSTAVFGLAKLGPDGRPNPGQVLIAPELDGSTAPPSLEPEEPSAQPTNSEASSSDSPDPTEEPSEPTAPECHNSFEPECGPFYWLEPPGPNAPVVVSIDIAPTNPMVGEEVTVTVTVSDEDARYVDISYAHWAEEGEFEIGTALGGCRTPYGPWTPPERKLGRETFALTHVYSKPGTYNVEFAGFSWSGDPWGGPSCYVGMSSAPYGGDGSARGVIEVSPGPSSSPTPSPSPTDSPSSTPTESPSPSPSASGPS